MLNVRKLCAGYGQAQVLFGVDFHIDAGEVVTLMGRNGMGKTTTLKAVMGMLPVTGGEVLIDGKPMQSAPPYRIARAGLGLVPEGRQIFPTLSVGENLAIAARRGGRWPLARVFELFPRLAERVDQPGRHLSGGEQQMLAIGRALMTGPRLLILDEATEGLAPKVREDIWSALSLIKAEGQAILIIDKNLAALTRLADRHLIMEKGRIVWRGDTAALAADPLAVQRHLGV